MGAATKNLTPVNDSFSTAKFVFLLSSTNRRTSSIVHTPARKTVNAIIILMLDDEFIVGVVDGDGSEAFHGALPE